jgi:hypothetical protein
MSANAWVVLSLALVACQGGRPEDTGGPTPDDTGSAPDDTSSQPDDTGDPADHDWESDYSDCLASYEIRESENTYVIETGVYHFDSNDHVLTADVSWEDKTYGWVYWTQTDDWEGDCPVQSSSQYSSPEYYDLLYVTEATIACDEHDEPIARVGTTSLSGDGIDASITSIDEAWNNTFDAEGNLTERWYHDNTGEGYEMLTRNTWSELGDLTSVVIDDANDGTVDREVHYELQADGDVSAYTRDDYALDTHEVWSLQYGSDGRISLVEGDLDSDGDIDETHRYVAVDELRDLPLEIETDLDGDGVTDEFKSYTYDCP